MTTSPFKFEIGEKVKYEDLGLGDALSVTPSRFFYEYYFLFVAHGATLTSHNMSMDLPLFDKEFSDMNFFSQNEKITTISTPDGSISPNFISRVINTPTYIINRGTRSTEWKVPPMFFSALKNDKKDILLRNFMGLWFIDYKTAQIDRLIDLPELLEISKAHSYRITYSVIDKFVREKVALLRSEGRITPGPHKMGMGFFSCRSALPNSSYLSQPIIETIPKQLKEANYYSTAEIEGGDAAFFRPFFFNTTFKYNAEIIEEMRVNPARFKPLATGIRHQGCAMNVLSFYKFIDTAFARNKVLCLTLRGTSIFRVLEFMNQKLYENNDEPVDYFELSRPSSKKYLIIRYHKDYFMRMFIPSISALNRYQAIVVKFYRDAFNPAAGQRGSTSARYSHVGHTVSFYVSYQEGHGNVIYMIDPQGDKYLRVGTPEFEDFLTHFNYYDIIYKPSKKETQKKYMKQIADEGRKIHHIISSTDINKERASRGDKVFIVDYEDIKFGGEKKTAAAAKKSSPMGVWELETEEADAAAPASQATRETYKFDGLPYSTPVLAPEVSERAYEHFMNYVRENEIKIPGSRSRRTTVAKSRKTGRSGTRRRKTI